MATKNGLLSQAISFREQKNYLASKEILSELLVEEPDDGPANYQMAWLNDIQGFESKAVPFYERALQGELSPLDRQGALLGLGSTYRCLAQYERSIEVLEKAIAEYPQNASFEVFLALTRFHQGNVNVAFSALLKQLVRASNDEHINKYKRALMECAEELTSA